MHVLWFVGALSLCPAPVGAVFARWSCRVAVRTALILHSFVKVGAEVTQKRDFAYLGDFVPELDKYMQSRRSCPGLGTERTSENGVSRAGSSVTRVGPSVGRSFGLVVDDRPGAVRR